MTEPLHVTACYQPNVRLAQVVADLERARYARIWYATKTKYWTHRADDLRIKDGLPVDPHGNLLIYTEKWSAWLHSFAHDRVFMAHHTLRALQCAHHANATCLGAPICFDSWHAYVTLLNQYDYESIQRTNEPGRGGHHRDDGESRSHATAQ